MAPKSRVPLMSPGLGPGAYGVNEPRNVGSVQQGQNRHTT